jgi:hypothetical protein
LAVVLIGVAAYSFSRGATDAAFVAGIVAICSFFLSYRFQIKARIDRRTSVEQHAAALPDDETSG